MKRNLIIGTALVLCCNAPVVLAQPPGGPGGFRQPAFTDLDSNADGKIMQEEFDAWLRGRFENAGDPNGRPPEGAREGRPEPRNGSPGFGSPGGRGPGGPGGGPQGLFAAWDSDGDGAVTEEEFNNFRPGGPGGPRARE